MFVEVNSGASFSSNGARHIMVLKTSAQPSYLHDPSWWRLRGIGCPESTGPMNHLGGTIAAIHLAGSPWPRVLSLSDGFLL